MDSDYDDEIHEKWTKMMMKMLKDETFNLELTVHEARYADSNDIILLVNYQEPSLDKKMKILGPMAIRMGFDRSYAKGVLIRENEDLANAITTLRNSHREAIYQKKPDMRITTRFEGEVTGSSAPLDWLATNLHPPNPHILQSDELRDREAAARKKQTEDDARQWVEDELPGLRARAAARKAAAQARMEGQVALEQAAFSEQLEEIKRRQQLGSMDQQTHARTLLDTQPLTLSNSYIKNFDGDYQYVGQANGKSHWKSDSGMHLYWGPNGSWMLRSKFMPDSPDASAFCDEEDIFMGKNVFQWSGPTSWVASALQIDPGPPEAELASESLEGNEPQSIDRNS